MKSALWLSICAALASSPVGASPVTRECTFKGPAALGVMVVTLDESARTVKAEYGAGYVYVYRNGARASFCASADDAAASDCDFVNQSVTIRADSVEVMLRNLDDGLIAHVAYFPRAAFKNPRAPCVWRSLWNFRAA